MARNPLIRKAFEEAAKREIEKLYRKQKRQIIQQDIRRQRKERYKKAQIEKRKAEEGNW